MKAKLILSLLLALTLTACGQDTAGETEIVLSDSGITVDGSPVSADPAQAVHTGADIVYYRDGTDETYGEGSEDEKHSAQEAESHTVVTITQPGTYRLSGTLSQGQIAVDLGEEAEEDPEALVTLILDGADVTCSVAPALIFYNVYECCEAEEETAGPDVDTAAAGANVVIAAGSENTFTGSHVARIYKEGTTDKLHKYDGAFYAKTSMNISGDEGDDSGVLNIVGDNEGLNSELHLTINGGTIRIQSQDDGINTNEDNISVTTVNGGDLTVTAGLGAEGDGIDSNGYLTINGGVVRTSANPQSPDGGVDADRAITINGGTLYAFGTRNDAADTASAQPYMELSFAASLPVGSQVTVTDQEGTELWSAVTDRVCQSITLTTPDLALDTPYSVYVDGVLQCWSGNASGMMGGGMGQMPEGFDPSQMEGFDPAEMEGEPPEMPENMDPGQMPQDFDPSQMEPGQGNPGRGGDMNMTDMLDNLPDEMIPEGYTREQLEAMSEEELLALYEENRAVYDQAMAPGMMGGMEGQTPDGSGSTEFTLTESTRSFSGVCDSDQSGKTRVTFTVEGLEGRGPQATLTQVTAITPSQEIDPSLVQITVADSPSEDYAASCLLSDGLDGVNALLPEDPGSYTLTVAVVSGDGDYTGASQVSFQVPE